MTEEQQAMARAFVACKAWKWLPGMQLFPVRAGVVDHIPERICDAEEAEYANSGTGLACLPDLADPVTAAAVLLVVREAWHGCKTYVWPEISGTWFANVRRRDFTKLTFSGPSELHAMLAALQTAPVTP